ncbi:hypothetical protein Lal_00043011 [Lupinus albus]|nr:hypothetical protein Lal_00043011 [Lupinus albus]
MNHNSNGRVSMRGISRSGKAALAQARILQPRQVLNATFLAQARQLSLRRDHSRSSEAFIAQARILQYSLGFHPPRVLQNYLPDNDPNSHPPIIDTIPLFQTSITPSCKHIFEINHKDFLRRYLVNSSYAILLTYASQSHIENLSCEIIAHLRQLYISHASNHGFTKSSDLRDESFDCDINITIDIVVNTTDEELAIQEQLSMQESVKMVPASDKDLQSLKT